MAERRTRLADGVRLRATLFIPLLLLCFGGTLFSVLILRTIVQQQVHANLVSDLQHSLSTYENLARQRHELIARESALLADLPSLKALMTADDRTIVDGGAEFWEVSGSDFFALLDRNARVVASYNRGAALDSGMMQRVLKENLQRPDDISHEPSLLVFDGRLYEVSLQPLLFGDKTRNSGLGFVAVGYAVDERVAREVSEAAAAEVTFAVDGRVVASTLTPEVQRQVISQAGALLRTPTDDSKIKLGKQDYLAASVTLGPSFPDSHSGVPQLVVLKSFDQAAHLVRRINRWILALALFALLSGTALLISISRTITRPIDELVAGTRALAMGNFEYRLSDHGVEEIRELSRAFERMRVTLQRTQNELLDSERLATIGSMASSISHDLRHYLSAMYANAEFMSDERLPQAEREELFAEVKTAVQGMTDLLDSLLLFTQTGRALHLSRESVAGVMQRAVSFLRSHPAARDVKITTEICSEYEATIDSRKLGRAVYNLLLNACQAAHRGEHYPQVTMKLEEDGHALYIRIADNGRGVPEAVRETMFLPFVSAGKESGLGLGLTLTQQIAQEHGGSVELDETEAGLTTFTITLPKLALQTLSRNSVQEVPTGSADSMDTERISNEANA